MKREFSIGDIAHLSKAKRMKGFVLPVDHPVKIITTKKIREKYGAYSYGVEVKNPKTGETEKYVDWFTQFDFYPKASWEKAELQNKIINEMGGK